jgi:hypothetical protein
MNIKKIIKEEMDSLDWIKDVDAYTPIEDLRIGEDVKVVWRNDILMEEALDTCDEYTNNFHVGDMYEVETVGETLSADSLFCDCRDLVKDHGIDCGKRYYSVSLKDIDSSWSFYISEDMLRVVRI